MRPVEGRHGLDIVDTGSTDPLSKKLRAEVQCECE
jgi:hypothetical protein